MLFFGDMMLDRDVANKIKQFGPDYPFTKLAGEENRFFMGMDIVHTNLEGAVADVRRPTSKSIAFNFEKELLQTLKKYNFDTVSLANNHSYDMGGAGFVETQKNLDEAGITHYGKQYEYNHDVSVVVKTIADQDIAFIGFNDTNRRLDLGETSGIVQKACNENDYCIVNIHWGYEYKQRSNPWQRELAHAYIDAGADAIIGHHPHVIQEMEVYKNKPIFYSLGNFIFDQYFSEETQQGLAVGMIFFQDELQLYLMPLRSQAAQVSLMPYEQAKALLEKVVLPKDITLSEQGLYMSIMQ
jgi:poly-gamma-glutamate synthesis protein (capsule biosynthesis protein)